MRVYLDNCTFNRPFDDQKQLRISLEAQAKIAIQDMISEGELTMVISPMNIYENQKSRKIDAKKRILHFMMRYGEVYTEESSKEFWDIQAEIESTGVKFEDSYHVAFAITSHCDFFITTDDRILKYKDDRIGIVSPIQFITAEVT